MTDYARALEVAVRVAREAGAIFREAFFRDGGPPGENGKSPVDVEAERLIRARIHEAFPSHGLRAEELPEEDRAPAEGEPHHWLIDPNDGTRGYLSGFREATVSIALIRGDVPVLGVVHAACMPLGAVDEFAWAEGEPLKRRGRPLPKLDDAPFDASTRIAISHNADGSPLANAASVQPARYLAISSLAYRLALAASGEVDASVSIKSPRDFDFAAGHALVRGAGGLLVDECGREPRYSVTGTTRLGFCFGGRPSVVRELLRRDFHAVNAAPPEPRKPPGILRPMRGRNERDAGIYDRALGALYGLFIGDAWGSRFEFQTAEVIARTPRERFQGLGASDVHRTISGQPTDDGELALSLARCLVEVGRFDARAVLEAYADWLESAPFDLGHTTASALDAAARARRESSDIVAAARSAAALESQANGATMRAAPLALAFTHASEADLDRAARDDAALTHPHPACLDANEVYLRTMRRLILAESSPEELVERACAEARDGRHHETVREALDSARLGPPEDSYTHMGFIGIALRHAFHALHTAENFETALGEVIAAGGDTDTNGAIAGALLGARFGASRIRTALRHEIRSARAIAGLEGVHRPRPMCLWPVDLEALAEALLALSRR
jgi:ADP-ribosyl-[dinitrogen reductase] hydrolase